MYVVYGLEDPRSCQIFYVGITDDVFVRFIQHLRCDGSNMLKDAKIQELKQANIMPSMPNLQEVGTVEIAKKREAYWIRHYYDLGMPLTNLVMPMCHENTIIIHEVSADKGRTPQLKTKMTPDEQREYLEYLLGRGKSRHSILRRVDGYIHPKFVNQVLDDCMLQSLPVPVLVPAKSVEQVNGRVPASPDDKLFTIEQEVEFVRRYKACGSIKECLSQMHLGYGRYQRCASRVVQERGLRRA